MTGLDTQNPADHLQPTAGNRPEIAEVLSAYAAELYRKHLAAVNAWKEQLCASALAKGHTADNLRKYVEAHADTLFDIHLVPGAGDRHAEAYMVIDQAFGEDPVRTAGKLRAAQEHDHGMFYTWAITPKGKTEPVLAAWNVHRRADSDHGCIMGVADACRQMGMGGIMFRQLLAHCETDILTFDTPVGTPHLALYLKHGAKPVAMRVRDDGAMRMHMKCTHPQERAHIDTTAPIEQPPQPDVHIDIATLASKALGDMHIEENIKKYTSSNTEHGDPIGQIRAAYEARAGNAQSVCISMPRDNGKSHSTDRLATYAVLQYVCTHMDITHSTYDKNHVHVYATQKENPDAIHTPLSNAQRVSLPFSKAEDQAWHASIDTISNTLDGPQSFSRAERLDPSQLEKTVGTWEHALSESNMLAAMDIVIRELPHTYNNTTIHTTQCVHLPKERQADVPPYALSTDGQRIMRHMQSIQDAILAIDDIPHTEVLRHMYVSYGRTHKKGTPTYKLYINTEAMI